MSRPSLPWTTIAAATSGIAAMALLAAPPAGAAAPSVTVVASGLNNPKHLAFGPGGLYIPEPGTGGDSCVTISGTSYCSGATGSIQVLGRSGLRTLRTGLPSVLNSSEGVFGAAAVTFYQGRPAVLMQDTAVRSDGTTGAQGPDTELLGKLLISNPSGGWTTGADYAAFAATHPQDPATLGGPPGETVYDADPYDVVQYRGGYAMADGAANDVVWRSPGGRLSVLDRLPTTPETVPAGVLGPDPVTIDAQAVPTSLAVGPDGALYVATFPGFPALAGTAKVYRLEPGRAPVAVVSGLTQVSDIAFDHCGRLLVLEYNTTGGFGSDSAPGALLRVGRGGAVSTLPVDGLNQATGLTVGADGAVYVAINGNTSAGDGEVLRITGLG